MMTSKALINAIESSTQPELTPTGRRVAIVMNYSVRLVINLELCFVRSMTYLQIRNLQTRKKTRILISIVYFFFRLSRRRGEVNG